MKLLADERLDAGIVAVLRAVGYEVAYVAELSPGVSDDAVLTMANERAATLVTSGITPSRARQYAH